MFKKRYIAFGVVVLVLVFSYFMYPFFVYGISVVKVESEGQKTLCYLQWCGRDQMALELTTLADLGRTNYCETKIVNNGEVFAVPVVANYSWVEITFNDKTVSLHSDGANATLTHVGYPDSNS